MGKPKAPTPPSPTETSAAQTSTNIGTAIGNNIMGMVDQYTPYGNLTYSQTGTKSWTDPYTGKTYDLPTYRSDVALSPQQQATLDQSQAAQFNLAGLANDQSGFLRNYLKDAGGVTDQIDSKLYDLGRLRLDPRFEQERAALESRLANQGIGAGSEAYNREMTAFGQTKNDAYNQLLLSGRGQAMAETDAPINRITALLSGSQVANPNVSGYQPQVMPTTDVAGLINQNYNQRLAGWQQKVAGQQSLLGGLFGLGAGALTGGYF